MIECLISLILNPDYYPQNDMELQNQAIKSIENLFMSNNNIFCNQLLLKVFNFYYIMLPKTVDDKFIDEWSQSFSALISLFLNDIINSNAKNQEDKDKNSDKKNNKKGFFSSIFSSRKKKEESSIETEKPVKKYSIINIYFSFLNEHKDNPVIIYSFMRIPYLCDAVGQFQNDNIKFIEEYLENYIKNYYSKSSENIKIFQTSKLTDKLLTLLIHIKLEIDKEKGNIDKEFHLMLQRNLNFSILAVKSIISYSFALDKKQRLDWQLGDKVSFYYNEENIKYCELTKVLFDDIVILLNNASSKGDIKKVDSLIMSCLEDISNHSNKSLLFNILFDMKAATICDYFESKLRLLEVTNNKERLNTIETDISILFKPLLSYHKSSFIFNMVYREIKYSEDLDYAKELFTKIVSQRILLILVSDSYSKINLKENLINLLVLLETLSKEKKDFLFHLIDFKFLVRIFHPITKYKYIEDRTLFKTDYNEIYETQPMKIIIEFMFDLSINLYFNMPNEETLEMILSFIFVENKNNINESPSKQREDILTSSKKELIEILSADVLKRENLSSYKTVFFIMDEILTHSTKNKNQNEIHNKQLDKISINLFFLMKIFILLNKKEKQKQLDRILKGLAKVICWDIAKLYDKKNSFLKDSKNSLYNKFKKAIESDFCKLNKKRKEEHLEDLFQKFKFLTSRRLLNENEENYMATHPSYSCLINQTVINPENHTCPGETHFSKMSEISYEGRIRSLSGSGLHVNKENDFSRTPAKASNFSYSITEAKPAKTKEKKKDRNSYNRKALSFNVQKDDEDKTIEPSDDNSNNNKIVKSFKDFNINTIVFWPKNKLLLADFSSVFKDVYFNNDAFIHLKQYYLSHFVVNPKGKQLNYPSKIRNFSNTIEPPHFLKQDFNFFSSEYFKISHPYFANFLSKIKIKKITLFPKSLLDMKPINEFECEFIKNDNSLFGKIYLYSDFIKFENTKIDPRKDAQISEKLNYVFSSLESDIIIKEKTIIFSYIEIKYVIKRRFLFMWQAAEIYLKNGKSYFFSFFSVENCKHFFKQVNTTHHVQIIDDPKKYFEIKNYHNKWCNYEMSNYKYLLIVNKFASRTFKEISQYPVFPWLLRKYSEIMKISDNYLLTPKALSKQNENKNIKKGEEQKFKSFARNNLRLFEYPISCQEEDKRKLSIMKFNEAKSTSKFPHSLGSHYSTSSFLYYYLMRLGPYTNCLIKLQNGQQESPNRMFSSFEDTQLLLESGHDNREIIPEFFSSFEYMINLNCNFFGNKEKNEIVDDILQWFKEEDKTKGNSFDINGYANYIIQHRKILNSHLVFDKINTWIDWVFGVNQITNKAETCNTFPKESYQEKINLMKKMEKKQNKKYDDQEIYDALMNKIIIIINFGQTPYKLFTHPLTKKPEEFEEFTNTDDIESFAFSFSNRTHAIDIDNSCIFFDLSENSTMLYTVSFTSKGPKVHFYETFFKKSKEFIALLSNPQIKKISSLDMVYNKVLKRKNFKEDKNENFIFPRKPEYTIIEMKNSHILISVNYTDNSFKIQLIPKKDKDKDKNKDIKINYNNILSIQTEDYVQSIAKINEDVFVIGLHNGKLIEYEIKQVNKETMFDIIENNAFYDHEAAIDIIIINQRLKIIVTYGEDNIINIRKLYDYELLSFIPIIDEKVQTIKISCINLMYVLCYDRKKNKSRIYGFTLTGINFAKNEENNYISSIEITLSGDVIITIRKTKMMFVLNGGNLKTKKRLTIDDLIKNNNEFMKLPDEKNSKIVSFKLVNEKENFLIAQTLNQLITIEIHKRNDLLLFT